MPDHENEVVPGKRLGKAPYRDDPRTLKAVRYLQPNLLPTPPPSYQWSPQVASWPMYANDKYGDCVFAGEGHHIQLLTAAGGSEVTLPEAEVLKAYSEVTGFSADNPASDQGTVMLDAMNHWLKVGVGGHQIAAFVEVDHLNHQLVKDALYLFGGLDVGVALPTSAQNMGQHWTRPRNQTGPNEPGSWGGHAIYIVDYDRYSLTAVTWGELTRIDWGFWDAYVDEVWAPLSHDLFSSTTGRTVLGLDFDALTADLAALGHTA